MTAQVASFGMYDPAAVQPANDALWQALRQWLRRYGMTDTPERLDRTRSLAAIWDDPGLLLAQTCGYPLMTAWRSRLRYVATPCYAAPGCDGPLHRSRLVVRIGDGAERLGALRGRVAAINERASNTGMNLLREAVAPLARDARFFVAVVETGSHLASARAVAGGNADIASIDAVTFALLERHEPALTSRLRTIGWSQPSLGLPLVTAGSTPPETVRLLRRGLRWLIKAPEAAEPREALLLQDIAILRPRRYEAILTAERRAVRAGYPLLA